MKRIILKRIELKNFKGIRSKKIDFIGKFTTIKGDNGTGKTTIFDAFTWALFGKDSKDSSNFDIKTLDEHGNPINKLTHSVKLILDVNGVDIEILREYKESWIKKRGTNEATLSGHKTNYFIDEVPKKANEYQKYISDNIIDETAFKYLTNPSYFNSLNWNNQRELLFSMAGSIDEQSILNSDQNIKDLFNKLSGKTLDDYKKQINVKRKKLKDVLNDIPSRIDEADQSKPEPVNEMEVKAKINDIEKEIEGYDSILRNEAAAMEEVYKERDKHILKVNQLKDELNLLEREIKDNSFKEYNKKLNTRNELEQNLNSFKFEIRDIEAKIERILSKIEINKAELKELSNKYDTVSQEVFKGDENSLICPLWDFKCGDPKSIAMHQQKKEEAQLKFNENKANKLNDINSKGQEVKNKIEQGEIELEKYKEEVKSVNLKIQDVNKEYLNFKDLKEPQIDLSKNDKYNSLIAEIKELQGVINRPINFTDNKEVEENKATALKNRDNLISKLNDVKHTDKINNRIKELEELEKRTAKQISEIDKDIFTIDKYNKAKTDLIENKVNGLFTYVNFKLFETQINGAEVPTCIALIDGVPYNSANTASQINAGIDIINALSDYYNCLAPIFVDHRESVNELIYTESQVIDLLVSKDKDLKII